MITKKNFNELNKSLKSAESFLIDEQFAHKLEKELPEMQRITIFSHYDKESKIDSYVVSYLEELQKYSEIIFVSDNNIERQEVKKIEHLCLDIITQHHGEYDFGSYKRGFKLILDKYPQKLQGIDELLFVNDSCYLLGGLSAIFSSMERKNEIDFWSLTDDYDNFDSDNIYFLGTFFISFRQTIFLKDFFQDFVSNVTKENDHDTIVYKYEVGLSRLLLVNGMKSYCYFSFNKIAHFIADSHVDINHKVRNLLATNSTLSRGRINIIINRLFNVHSINYLHSDKIYLLFCNGFPLIKRRIIGNNNFPEESLLYLWHNIVEEFYPGKSKQIISNCQRIGFNIKYKKGINRDRILLTLPKLIYFKKYYKNNFQHTSVKILFFKYKSSNKEKKASIFGISLYKKTI